MLLSALLCAVALSPLPTPAQPPSQETFNKQFYAVMEAFPGGFLSIKGAYIDGEMGITDYACNLVLDGTDGTELWHNDENHGPGLHFQANLATVDDLEESLALYEQWYKLLDDLELMGAPFKMESSRSDGQLFLREAIFTWEKPGSIRPEFLGFKPRLRLDKFMGSYRLVLQAYKE